MKKRERSPLYSFHMKNRERYSLYSLYMKNRERSPLYSLYMKNGLLSILCIWRIERSPLYSLYMNYLRSILSIQKKTLYPLYIEKGSLSSGYRRETQGEVRRSGAARNPAERIGAKRSAPERDGAEQDGAEPSWAKLGRAERTRFFIEKDLPLLYREERHAPFCFLCRKTYSLFFLEKGRRSATERSGTRRSGAERRGA